MSGDSWESRHRSYRVTNRQFLRNARDLYMGGTELPPSNALTILKGAVNGNKAYWKVF